MKISEPRLTVGKTKQGLANVRGTGANMQSIAQGLSNLGQNIDSAVSNWTAEQERVAQEEKQKRDQMARFKATAALVDFNTRAELEQDRLRKEAAPDDTMFARKATEVYLTQEEEFIKTLPEDMQEEFFVRAADTRARITLNAHDFQEKQLTTYYTGEINKRTGVAVGEIAQNPEALEKWRAEQIRMVVESDMSETSKRALVQQINEVLEKNAYRATIRKNRLDDAQFSDELSTSVRQVSQEFGINPIDLMTVISYETGGKFSTGTRGGAGNRHIGLIQFGAEEQKKYGVYPGQPVGEQMKAVALYLRDRGFKPGMSLAQLYATINAGNPGGVNASDEKNGGMPGTVLDKINSPEWAEHRAKAIQMLDGKYIVPDEIDNDPRFANVFYEDRIAARNDVNVEVNAMLTQMKEERKLATQAFNNALYLQLDTGPLGGMRQTVEEAVAAGHLQDYEDRKKAYDIIERREKDVNTKKNFMTRIDQGRVLDPTDPENKKGMDLFFGEVGEKALNEMNSQYIENVLAPVFERTQMLPPNAVSLLSTLASSNDPRQMLYAYKSLNTLEERNPRAYAAQVPEATRNAADRWELLKDTMTDEELIKTLQPPKTIQERNDREKMRDEAQTILNGKDSPVSFELVQEAFNGAVLPLGPKGRAMEREWRQLVIENYAKTGGMSIEEANRLAIKQLQRVWGQTQLDGRPTIMRHPPEHFPGNKPIGGSHEWMTRQIRGEAGIADDENIVIISDMQTEQEVNSGQPPSYLVFKEKDGVLTQVEYDQTVPVNTNTGMATETRRVPYRHYFKPTESDEKVDETAVRLEQKKSELQYFQNLVNTGETWGRLVSREAEKKMIPDSVRENIARLETEIQELEGQYGNVAAEAKRQYDTPAMQRLKEVERAFAPINAELMNWVDPPEDFPKVKEWEAMYDEIQKLKKTVADELAARRAKMGAE